MVVLTRTQYGEVNELTEEYVNNSVKDDALMSNSDFINKVVQYSNINFMEDDKSYLIKQLDQQILTKKDVLDWIAFLSSPNFGKNFRENTIEDVINWTIKKNELVAKLGTNITKFNYGNLLLLINNHYIKEKREKAAAKKAAAEKAAAEKAPAEEAATDEAATDEADDEKETNATEVKIYQRPKDDTSADYQKIFNNFHIVNLNKRIEDSEAIAIAAAFNKENTMHTLYMNNNTFLTNKGFTIIANNIKNSRLKHLDFNYCHYSIGSAIVAIVEIMKHKLLKILSLVSLKISDWETIADVLATNKTNITSLNLADNNCSNAISILEALASNNKLRILNLSGTTGQFKISLDVTPLRISLTNNRTLTELNLSENSILDHSIKALVDGLKENTTLLILNLERNKIDKSTLIDIVEMLKTNTGLRQLYLSNMYNEEWNDKDIQKIIDALTQNKTLELMWFSNNMLNEKYKKTIITAAKKNSNLKLFI